MYVRITNEGLCDVESFFLLGVSSARGEKGKIGQFGSGVKHAILIALRANIEIQILVGHKRVIPKLETVLVNKKPYNRLYFLVDDEKIETSMTTSFGEIDWEAEIDMMMREIISNSLDAVGGDWNRVEITTTENILPMENKTSVYIEGSYQIFKYLESIEKYFLHSTGEHEKRVIRNKENSSFRFYRCGVFVRELENEKSIFHYNGDEDTKIDEARNMDSWTVRSHAARLLSKDKEAIKIAMKALEVNGNYAEAEFSTWYLDQQLLADVFIELYSINAVVTCSHNIKMLVEQRKRAIVIVLPSTWSDAIVRDGRINDAIKLLNPIEKLGHNTSEAPKELEDRVSKVWKVIERLKLTRDKPMPKVFTFHANTQNSETILGYSDKESIYLSHTIEGSIEVILEELCHYISGAKDETRDFQTFLLQIMSELVKSRMRSGKTNTGSSNS